MMIFYSIFINDVILNKTIMIIYVMKRIIPYKPQRCRDMPWHVFTVSGGSQWVESRIWHIEFGSSRFDYKKRLPH